MIATNINTIAMRLKGEELCWVGGVLPGLLSWLDVAAPVLVASRCLSLLVSLCARGREGERGWEGAGTER